MKKLRHDLDFTKTYGSVPESFETRVRATLNKTAQEAQSTEAATVQRRPVLRVAIVVAVLLALTATAVAAMYSRTKEWYLGPHGLHDPEMRIASDMENGTVSYAGQSKQLGGLVFTIDDVVWGENDLYATGTYRLADDPTLMILPDMTAPTMPYAPFGTDPGEDAMSYLSYAESNGLRLVGARVSMNGYLDADGAVHTSDSSFYAYEESEGVHRFGLMFFIDPERMQAARAAGSRFRFTLPVYEYDESGRPEDMDEGSWISDDWNPSGWVSDDWVLALPEEE